MPEGVSYGPQYTASTGLSLNYVGEDVAAVVTAIWISKVFPDVTPSAVFSWTTQLATPVPPLAA